MTTVTATVIYTLYTTFFLLSVEPKNKKCVFVPLCSALALDGEEERRGSNQHTGTGGLVVAMMDCK